MTTRESYGCPDHPDHLVVFAVEDDAVTIIADCPECCRGHEQRRRSSSRTKIKRTSRPDSRLRLAVRRHCCAHSVSIRALAKASKIPRMTLHRWLYADGPIHLSRAAALAEAVGCTIRISVDP